MKKIPTNSFKILRIISIIFIVLGLVPIVIMLSASIAVLFNNGFTDFIFALVAAIVFSLPFLFIVFLSFIMKGLCETGISFSEHVSRQTKILEEINKKLDNKETQEISKQTKICEETDEKLDNEETQETQE